MQRYTRSQDQAAVSVIIFKRLLFTKKIELLRTRIYQIVLTMSMHARFRCNLRNLLWLAFLWFQYVICVIYRWRYVSKIWIVYSFWNLQENYSNTIIDNLKTKQWHNYRNAHAHECTTHSHNVHLSQTEVFSIFRFENLSRYCRYILQFRIV